MITKLTPALERRMQEFLEEWLKIGRATAPLNRAAAGRIVTEFYKRINKPAPVILYFSSPMMCALAWCALQLESQLGSQLGSQLDLQLDSQLRSQLWSQLDSQLGSQVWSQLGLQLGLQLGSQLDSQLGSQLDSQLRSQLDSQLDSQLRSQLDSQLRSQLDSQLRSQLWSQLDSQLRSHVWSQLGSQLDSQLRSHVWSQLDSQLRSQLGSQLRNGHYFAGQHWCAWEVFYSFCREIGVKYAPKDEKLLNLWLDQSRELHWWFPYDGIVFVSERHTIVEVDSQGRLHSETGQACGYSDTWGIWAWHGVVVPQRVIEEPDKLTAEEILQESNAEVRRVMIERVGMERFLTDSRANKIHSCEMGELFSIDLPEDPERVLRAVRVRCPSTGRHYFLRVPPQISRADDAVAWTFGFDTAGEYRPIKQT